LLTDEIVMADVRRVMPTGVSNLKQYKSDNVAPCGMRVAIYPHFTLPLSHQRVTSNTLQTLSTTKTSESNNRPHIHITPLQIFLSDENWPKKRSINSSCCPQTAIFRRFSDSTGGLSPW
jgi:hypothetical protein